MPGFIKQAFFILVLMLLGFRTSLAMKCVSMNNQPCMVRPRFIDLNLDELHYYPFTISLGRCYGSCNTAEYPFGRICVPKKLEDVNMKVFNMIKGINESKTLIKYISCACRCKLDD